MKYLPLIWASLFRRKVRTILTLLSVVAAFLLFGLLDSVRSTFAHAGQSARGSDRLVIVPKVGGADLPVSLHASIQGVPGAIKTTYGSALSATYRDPKNFVPIEGQADNAFDLYPEVAVSPAAFQAFLGARTGALVRLDYAEKYGWKPGDTLPFQTNVLQKNGSSTWTFDVVGIYDLPEPKIVLPPVLVHWDYFDEARQSRNGTVDWFNVVVAEPNLADPVAHAIDALSANSSHETQTQSENAFFAKFLRQFANIGLIVGSIMGAVSFTLVLLTGNAMAQAVRERLSEIAVLKTIGFTDRGVLALILSESVVLLVLGAAVGLACASVGISVARAKWGALLPMPIVAGNVWLGGLSNAVFVGLLVGAIPARRGLRLRIVNALAGH